MSIVFTILFYADAKKEEFLEGLGEFQAIKNPLGAGLGVA